MKKHKAQKDILYVSISSFILTTIWISFNIYHSYVSTTIAPTLQLQVQPIEPSFDVETIQKLKNRNNVVPIYEIKNSQSSSSEADTQTDTKNSVASTESAVLKQIDNFIETTGE